MKLINSSFEILDQTLDINGIYKQIELAGRTCYKSEAYITDTSAKEFVERMMKLGHCAMLEHGTVYLQLNNTMGKYFSHIQKYIDNFYSNVVEHVDKNDLNNLGIYFVTYNITTNLRVLFENDWLDDLKYLCEPTEHHEKRISVKFICDRGVSHEFVRHRVFSFAQESTRYCNYSKDKFGKELTFILPDWMNIQDDDEGILVDRLHNIDLLDYSYLISTEEDFSMKCDAFLYGLMASSRAYFDMLRFGYTAQQARQVLPNALKIELVMTGFVSDWKHFFELRTPGSAHPDARALAIPLEKEFINQKYI